ncbi:MAG: HAD family hydrolase [Leptospiraceae bacterium]|nr:HAD family hydrolase [Leptospiraceae bacterium]
MKKIIESKQFWIFDMDGTLTEAMHDFPAIKKELGTPEDIDILEAISRVSKEEGERIHKRLLEIEFEIAKKAKHSTGSIEFLEFILSRNSKIGILTRNSLVNTWETLKSSGLSSYFPPDTIIAREHFEPKPSPEGILHLMKLWNASGSETIMVGDYIFDLEAGRNANVSTLYYDPTGRFIFADHSNYRFSDFSEINEILT